MSAPAAGSSSRSAPFQLRGAGFTMMVLRVGDWRNPNFFPVLASKVGQAPDFFRNAPVVLDLEEMPPAAGFDFPQFCSLLRNMGLVAVGLQGGTREQQQAAVAAGLALVPPGRPPTAGDASRDSGSRTNGTAPPAAPSPEPPPPAMATPGTPSLVVTEPIRSGRQVYARGGDLVVVAPVSPGAELAADGSIHVYGALRGRALAGVSGDRTARIFCLSLEAELVSIAGLYRVSEDIDRQTLRRPVQVFLEDGFLHIQPVGGT